jgi:uncharacterized protein (DUF488 family)
MEFLPWTTIYTIGHGRHPLAYFVELLKRYHIVLVCDVRSVARSRWPQFNCHRVGMLATPLRARGARIIHILPDGTSIEFDESAVPSIW